MTMTTGEFDFDSIFRQDPTGGSDDAEEIPFPQISYILWIVFVILMPILLTNMLVNSTPTAHKYFIFIWKVGLAVGDISAIQNEAELKELALQVNLLLAGDALVSNTSVHIGEASVDCWRNPA